MTPAETLRAAAKLLRDTAKNTSPTPWTCGGYGNYGPTVGAHMPPGKWNNDDLAIETSDSARGQADAAWISIAHPGLAEPLAAWLESAAREADGNEYRPPRRQYDPTEALAVARAVLGQGASGGQ